MMLGRVMAVIDRGGQHVPSAPIATKPVARSARRILDANGYSVKRTAPAWRSAGKRNDRRLSLAGRYVQR
jgi:hypothetical protein